MTATRPQTRVGLLRETLVQPKLTLLTEVKQSSLSRAQQKKSGHFVSVCETLSHHGHETENSLVCPLGKATFDSVTGTVTAEVAYPKGKAPKFAPFAENVRTFLELNQLLVCNEPADWETTTEFLDWVRSKVKKDNVWCVRSGAITTPFDNHTFTYHGTMQLIVKPWVVTFASDYETIIALDWHAGNTAPYGKNVRCVEPPPNQVRLRPKPKTRKENPVASTQPITAPQTTTPVEKCQTVGTQVVLVDERIIQLVGNAEHVSVLCAQAAEAIDEKPTGRLIQRTFPSPNGPVEVEAYACVDAYKNEYWWNHHAPVSDRTDGLREVVLWWAQPSTESPDINGPLRALRNYGYHTPDKYVTTTSQQINEPIPVPNLELASRVEIQQAVRNQLVFVDEVINELELWWGPSTAQALQHSVRELLAIGNVRPWYDENTTVETSDWFVDTGIIAAKLTYNGTTVTIVELYGLSPSLDSADEARTNMFTHNRVTLTVTGQRLAAGHDPRSRDVIPFAATEGTWTQTPWDTVPGYETLIEHLPEDLLDDETWQPWKITHPQTGVWYLSPDGTLIVCWHETERMQRTVWPNSLDDTERKRGRQSIETHPVEEPRIFLYDGYTRVHRKVLEGTFNADKQTYLITKEAHGDNILEVRPVSTPPSTPGDPSVLIRTTTVHTPTPHTLITELNHTSTKHLNDHTQQATAQLTESLDAGELIHVHTVHPDTATGHHPYYVITSPTVVIKCSLDARWVWEAVTVPLKPKKKKGSLIRVGPAIQNIITDPKTEDQIVDTFFQCTKNTTTTQKQVTLPGTTNPVLCYVDEQTKKNRTVRTWISTYDEQGRVLLWAHTPESFNEFPFENKIGRGHNSHLKRDGTPKKRFDTEREATRVANRINERDGKSTCEAYKCTECFGYHVGN